MGAAKTGLTISTRWFATMSFLNSAEHKSANMTGLARKTLGEFNASKKGLGRKIGPEIIAAKKLRKISVSR